MSVTGALGPGRAPAASARPAAAAAPGIAYRRDIDGLRALAVVPVVLSHAAVPGFSGGFVGVDVFFVISGYLITAIVAREIAEGRFSLLGFYERRARRILPALLAMLLGTALAGLLLFSPDAYAAFAKSIAATLGFASNIWFWQTTGDYFGVAAHDTPLLHTWSLAVEEQFYLVMPLLLMWLVPRGRAGAWILGLSLVSLALSVWATRAHPAAAFFLTPARAWELGLGALLALGMLRPPGSARVARAAAWAGLGGIVLPVGLYDAATPFPGLAALPPALGAAALIWAGTGRVTGPGRALSAGPVVALGLVSYSLYLWHWPVLVAARGWTAGGPLSPALTLACLVLSLALAVLSWRLVEQPCRRARVSRRAVFGWSLGGMAAVAGCAGLILARDGLPGRLPPEVLAAHQVATTRSAVERRCLARVPCPLGAAGVPDILVWGDSHAASLVPGVEAWLLAEDRAGLAAVRSACPPLPGIQRPDLGPGDGCLRMNARVLAHLEAHPEIATVILVARWGLLAEGSRMPGEGGLPARLARPDGRPVSLAEAVQETVDTLQAIGREVVIVEAVPELTWSPPRALLVTSLTGAARPGPLPRADYEARTAAAHAALAAAAPDRLLSLQPVLCPDGVCLDTLDGALLYRDNDHLSVSGALRVAPALLQTLP